MSDTCGRVRPGTLGYQHCVREFGHTGLHRSQDRTDWEEIADYRDGAGYWAVIRIGDTLAIATPNQEYLTSYLMRAPEYDRQYWPEFRISARYGACDDWGTEGVVWIDGEGYTLNTY